MLPATSVDENPVGRRFERGGQFGHPLFEHAFDALLLAAVV